MKSTLNIKSKLFLLLLIVIHHFSKSQSKVFLDSLFRQNLGKYQLILDNPKKYKVQVIYTQINRDAENKPSFKSYKFHSNSQYFYPASTVKLPVTVVGLIKLNELRGKGIDLNTPLFTDSAFYCQKKISSDTTCPGAKPTIGNYIKKMWLVSDNASCSRVYEFIGCDYLHKKLESIGFDKVRINNRLDGYCPGDTAKVTPPIYFVNNSNDTLYKQGLTFSSYNKPHPIEKSIAGKYHRDANGKKRPGPKNFAKHNYFALSDLNEMMKRMVFNSYLKETDQLPISNADRLFVLKHSAMMPRECDYTIYHNKDYYDSYKKYFIYGSAVANTKEDSIRIFNIVGRAYGFLIDCAYIVDFKNKVEYMLTASVFVNQRGDIGGGRYEYEALGLPFLRDVSLCIYNYEKKRVKKHQPDLKEFNFFDYK